MGQRRTSSIARFNVDTHLKTNPKFLRFRRLLSLDESRAYALVIGLINFTALNRGISGCLDNLEPFIIADFVGWNSEIDGDPEILIDAYIRAGFIEVSEEYGNIRDFLGKYGTLRGNMSNWFFHQPLAKKIQTKRDLRQDVDNSTKGDKKQTDTQQPPKKSPKLKTRNVDNSSQPLDYNGTERAQSKKGYDRKINPQIQDNSTDIRDTGLYGTLRAPYKYKTDKNIKEESKSPSLLLQKIGEMWNQLAKEHPNIPRIRLPLSKARIARLKNRCRETEFDFPAILDGIRESGFVNGDNGRGWVVDFDWVIKGPMNYEKLLDGRWRDPPHKLKERARKATEKQEIEAQKKLRVERWHKGLCVQCGSDFISDGRCDDCNYTQPQGHPKAKNPDAQRGQAKAQSLGSAIGEVIKDATGETQAAK